MDEINQNLTTQEQLKIHQLTEREAKERSNLNLRQVLNQMNQQHSDKANELDEAYAKRIKELISEMEKQNDPAENEQEDHENITIKELNEPNDIEPNK